MKLHERTPALLGRLFMLWQIGGMWHWVDDAGRERSMRVSTEQFERLSKAIRAEFADPKDGGSDAA